MASKKQILVPIAVLAVGVGVAMTLSAMKEPPAEKEKLDLTPLVAVEEVQIDSINLSVGSYGVVQPKYETNIVSQVSGLITELSPDFVRGGFVKKGDVLATIDSSDYEAAFIDAEANYASAIASLELEKAQGKVAEKEWQRILHTEPTELSLRKPQLAQEMARVKAAEASVKRATRNLERTKIVAPYDAIIERRDIGLGTYVSTGKELGKLLNVQVAKIRLPVADNQLQFLDDQGIGAKVTLTTQYSGSKQQWQAEIIRSEGVIDNESRMNYLVAEIADPYGREHNNNPIRFGTYVNATIEGFKVDAAAIVPRHLVNNEQIAVLNDKNQLSYQQVEILQQRGAQVIIAQGLAQGDKIITSALDFPVAGMKLTTLDDMPKEQEDDTFKGGETQLALKDN